MSVKTYPCEACRRDMPQKMLETVTTEGVYMLACTDIKECRNHWPKEPETSCENGLQSSP